MGRPKSPNWQGKRHLDRRGVSGFELQFLHMTTMGNRAVVWPRNHLMIAHFAGASIDKVVPSSVRCVGMVPPIDLSNGDVSHAFCYATHAE